MDVTTTAAANDIYRKTTNELHWVDYLLFSLTLCISLGIGIYTAFAGGGQKTTKTYLMGDRNMSVVPVSLSIFMSFVSAILVLGNTAEMYHRGTLYWMQSIGNIVSYFTIGLIFIPLFFPLNITSSFEYLEMRFKHKSVKIVGTLYLMISQVLYMGIAMFSPATALQAATNFPVWASILACGTVATIYTTIGGMKAVIWTDAFQGCVYMIGIMTILGVGVSKSGGIAHIWKFSGQENRLVDFKSWDTWTFNPAVRLSIWPVIIGSFIASHQTSGTGQTSVQRYCSLPTLNKARLSILLNAPAIALMFTITCLMGLTVFTYYNDIVKCDPLTARYINNPNQLLPYFVMDVINQRGIPGIFLAVLFSGALSTVSSSLSALSAVTWKDLLEWKFHYINEERKTIVTKFLAFLFGLIAIGMAFLAQSLGGHVLQASQSFVTGVAGPLLGMFILGGVFPCANWIGAVIGSIIGLALTMWIAIGAYITKPYQTTLPVIADRCPFNYTRAVDPQVFPLYKVSFLWYASIGTFTTVILGLIISFATGPTDPKSVNPKHIIPLFDWCYCCLPESFRKKLRCWLPNYANDNDDNDDNVVEEEKFEMKNGSLSKIIKSNQIEPISNVDQTLQVTKLSQQQQQIDQTISGGGSAVNDGGGY